MPQAAAEIALTLADGNLPSHLTLAAPPGDIPVPHFTTADGQVLVLAQPGSQAWRALIAAGEDEPAVLTVDDIPPFSGTPWLGRVHVCGWLRRVEGRDWPQDAVAFAATSPLATAGGLGLFRVEVGEVWLDQAESVALEPGEFAAARADPLRVDERSLLLDLRQHHLGELAALVPGLPGQCLPVRLDRYGLVLAEVPPIAQLARVGRERHDRDREQEQEFPARLLVGSALQTPDGPSGTARTGGVSCGPRDRRRGGSLFRRRLVPSPGSSQARQALPCR